MSRLTAAALLSCALLASPKARGDSALSVAAAEALGASSGPSPATGVPFGPFLVYPALTLGAVATDNLYPAATRRDAAAGARFAPRIAAFDDDGVRKTSLYLNMDAEWFPGASAQIPQAFRSPLTVDAEAHENWSPQPGLSLDAGAAFTRQSAALSPEPLADPRLLAAPSLVNLSPGEAFLDRVEASLSMERALNSGFFVRAGAQAESVASKKSPTPSTNSDGRDLDLSARLGRKLTPTIEAFVEAGEIWQRRDNSALDADISRAVLGVSSDLISLFRGEAHFGYQREESPGGAFASNATPTYGATIHYYPTEFITLSASLDHAYAFAALGPASAAASAAPDLWQARLQADYTLAGFGRATAGLAFARTDGVGEQLTAWLANAEVHYELGRGLDLAFLYSFVRARGGAGAASYVQNLGSVGLTYKY